MTDTPAPAWIGTDDEPPRLTIADLRRIAVAAIHAIGPAPTAAQAATVGELHAIVMLCDDASMTAGELRLPEK